MEQRNHISPIVYNGKRFLITDRPTDQTMPEYIKILKEHHVVHLVRVCEPSYDLKPLEQVVLKSMTGPFLMVIHHRLLLLISG